MSLFALNDFEDYVSGGCTTSKRFGSPEIKLFNGAFYLISRHAKLAMRTPV